VVDAGGITAAQATLNLGQSTISTHLATLEARLGFRLCERGRGGFRLTAKGRKFVAHARQLLGALTEFSMAVRNMDRKLVGVLNLGLSDHLPVTQSARISHAISRFRRRDQAVTFSVIVRPARDLEEQLLNGQIHVAFGYFWHCLPNLEYTRMFTENQIACCGREHPLFVRAGQVTAAEAAAYEWAWRSYPLPEARFSTSQHRVTAIADDMSAVAVLVMSGRHLAFLPEHFAEAFIRQKLIAPLNPTMLRYDVPFQRTIKRGSSRNEVLRAFLDDLELSGASINGLPPEVPANNPRNASVRPNSRSASQAPYPTSTTLVR
jgi:DNA-binding transcriptional LysR family regulator